MDDVNGDTCGWADRLTNYDGQSLFISSPGSTSTRIYRFGGSNASSLTPEENDLIERRGLSFSTKPSWPCVMTTIEALNSTGIVYAIQDGPNSVWTQAIKSAVVKWDGIR